MEIRATDEVQLLLQASTLLARLAAADRTGGDAHAVVARYRTQIDRVVGQLIALTAGPPTPRHIEAHMLLAELARYAFDAVMNRLEDSVLNQPLGFRTWRAISKLVTVSQEDARHEDNQLTQRLRPRVLHLVAEMETLRGTSIYPGRSLDLELMVAIPAEWTPGNVDPVNGALYERARTPGATLRERATAALGLWQRVLLAGRDHSDPAQQELTRKLETLVSEFQGEAARADISDGLRWAAETLNSNMVGGSAAYNSWPEPGGREPWYQAVHEITNGLDDEPLLPKELLPGVKNLFLHLLLQNAGIDRRRAIDTLAAAGLVEMTARTLARVLRDSRMQEWLRVRALFALGFMQQRHQVVEAALIAPTRKACAAIGAPDPRRAQITELQTAFFAIGDVYGVPTSELSRWALANRFNRVGTIRPLLDAA